MSSMTFGQKSFTPTAPDKGSFPLDHEGRCKKLMLKFMVCLSNNNNNNSLCRAEAKDYLGCRMENNLMVKEDWSKLGFDESDSDNTKRSVAALKLPLLLQELENFRKTLQIRVVVTDHSTHFFSTSDIPEHVTVYRDTDEWSMWSTRGDPVLHIDLAKWADVFVIAPLDANTLGKLANGLCDNLLTCIARAWEQTKPLLFCPAMNTKMWEHPVTETQINILEGWGYHMVPCCSKTLMCGDTGLGAMAEVATIVKHIKEFVL